MGIVREINFAEDGKSLRTELCSASVNLKSVESPDFVKFKIREPTTQASGIGHPVNVSVGQIPRKVTNNCSWFNIIIL